MRMTIVDKDFEIPKCDLSSLTRVVENTCVNSRRNAKMT